jgi:hypothetical protein
MVKGLVREQKFTGAVPHSVLKYIRASRTIALCKQCPQAFANTLIAALPICDYDEYRK